MEQLQNLEIEQQILGLTIANKIYFERIEDLIKSEHFSIEFHQKLFERITEIRKTTNSELIQVFLNQYFNDDEKQTIVYMIHGASSNTNIRDYAFSLIELYQKRETLKAMDDFQNAIIEKNHKYDFATSELLDRISKIDGANQDNAKTYTLAEIEKEIESRTNEEEYLPTGFTKLDEVLNGGLGKGNLTVVGARTGAGKTSWAQQVILNIAKQNKVCLFASLEVNNSQVYDKFASMNKSIPFVKILTKTLNQTEMNDYNKSKEELRGLLNNFIYIKDNQQTIRQIESMVKRHIAKRKLDLLMVDYIQIIKREHSNNISEATAIKDITRGLADISKKYNIAVLGLAQINREGATDPKMENLKGSGGIEEDADCIILLHRPINDEGILSADGAFKLVKNRWGDKKNIKFSFNGEITTFFEKQ